MIIGAGAYVGYLSNQNKNSLQSDINSGAADRQQRLSVRCTGRSRRSAPTSSTASGPSWRPRRSTASSSTGRTAPAWRSTTQSPWRRCSDRKAPGWRCGGGSDARPGEAPARRLWGDGGRRAVDRVRLARVRHAPEPDAGAGRRFALGLPSSNDFASVLLPVAPPTDGSSAAWFLTSATETTGLALVRVSASGESSGLTLTGAALDDLGGNPVTAMAEIPGTGTALLGAPPTFHSLLTVESVDADRLAVRPFVVADRERSAARGRGGGGEPDRRRGARSGRRLELIGPRLRRRFHRRPCARRRRSDQLPDHAVGQGAESGHRATARWSSATCWRAGRRSPLELRARRCRGASRSSRSPPAPSAARVSWPRPLRPTAGSGRRWRSATSTATAFRICWWARPRRASISTRGPIAPGAAPTATIAAPLGSASFGAALAAVNVDGVPGDEALVGDPGATINGLTGAGNVSIYTGPTLAPR